MSYKSGPSTMPVNANLNSGFTPQPANISSNSGSIWASFLALYSDRTNAISLAVLRAKVSIESRKASPGILPASAFLSVLRSVSMAASGRLVSGECSTEYEYGSELSYSYSGGGAFGFVSSTSVSVDGLTGIESSPTAESSSAESDE